MPPVRSKQALPDWLRTMPSTVQASSVNLEVRTLKQCPPVIDAMSLGVTVFLSTDIRVDDDGFHWDWNFPILPDTLLPRAPLSVHVPEQVQAVPAFDDHCVLKFHNWWTFETEPGYSLYCKHPSNRLDLPFHTLEGLVDSDRFKDGLIHFPARWVDDAFKGILPRGTPIAQLFPIKRAPMALVIDQQSDDHIQTTRQVQNALSREVGVYRKQFRVAKPDA